jgi:hypothetical protein
VPQPSSANASGWNAEAARLDRNISGIQVMLQDLATAHTDLKDQIDAVGPTVDSRIQVLEEDSLVIRHRLTGNNTYSHNNVVLGSAGDVLKYFKDDLDDVSIGWFLDVFTGLCRAGNESYDGGKEMSDRAYLAKKIFSTTLETEMMATFSHTTPLILFGKSDTKRIATEPEEGFGHRLATFKKFSGQAVLPARVDIQNKVKNIMATIRGTIVGTGPAQDLAKHLLNEVSSQLAELLSFMTEWHDELTQQCNYQTNTAWLFIGLCVRAMMDHLVPPRMAVSGLDDFQSKDNKATIIWSVLEVHIRLNEMISAKWKAHRVITTAMSNFVMKSRVDAATVTELATKLAAALKRMDVLEKELMDFKQKSGNKLAVLEKNKKKKGKDGDELPP